MSDRPQSRPPTRPPLPPPNPHMDETPDFMRRAETLYDEWHMGRLTFEQLGEMLDELWDEDRSQQRPGNLARLEFTLGTVQINRKQFDEAIRHFEQAREQYVQAGNNARANSCSLNLAIIRMEMGDWAVADRLFESLSDSGVLSNDLQIIAIAQLNRGRLFLRRGQADSARDCLQTALVVFASWPVDRSDRLPHLRSEAYEGLARVELEAGRLKEAYSAAQNALEQAEVSERVMARGAAHRAMGQVLGAMERQKITLPAESRPADEYFEQAATYFRQLEATGEIAATFYEHGVAMVGRGEKDKARALLRKAMMAFQKAGLMDEAAKAAELHTSMI